MPSEGIIAAVIGAIASVIAAFLSRGYWLPFKPCIRVKRIVDPSLDDLDFHVAMDLYARRIPADELCSRSDTQRWLAEAHEAGKNEDADIQEYFYVALSCEERNKSDVCGMLYFTYYPNSRPPFAFISYIVVDNQIAKAAKLGAAAAMIGATKDLLDNELKHCKGFIAEVDDPDSPGFKNNPKKRRKALGRIDRFKTLAQGSFDVLELKDVPYKQPDLTPPGNPSEEIPMRLLYIPAERGSKKVSDQRIREIVTFVYDYIYGDSFLEDGKRNQEYEKYLVDLRERVIEASRPDGPKSESFRNRIRNPPVG